MPSLAVSIGLNKEATQVASCWVVGGREARTLERLKVGCFWFFSTLLAPELYFLISFSWRHIYLQLLNIRRLQSGDLFKAQLLKCLF